MSAEERTPMSATRRALMFGVAAISTAIAAPAVALAMEDPDARLLELDRESAAIQGPLDEASRLEEEAYLALGVMAPPKPSILTFTADDAKKFGFTNNIGYPFGWNALELLPKYRAAALPQAQPFHLAALARIEEVQAAQAEWERYKLKPDYVALKAERDRQGAIVDRLGERQSDIWAEMLTLRAVTPAGLKAKARICQCPEPPKDDPDEELWPITVYRSLRADILAMEG